MNIKGKENKVFDALNKNMQVIHMEAIDTYESYLKISMKEVLVEDENFIQVRNELIKEQPKQKYDSSLDS